MTLQQLRYVVTVAETGNITEAARRLFISQPSLTNAVRELEKEMQITIFNRTNKGVSVSNEGDLFLSYARQILEQTSLLEEKFLHKTLRETQTYEIIEDVSRLKSEIGILYTSSRNEEVLQKLMRQNELQWHELFCVRPHVFICCSHPLADHKILTLEELEDYPYLSFEQGAYNAFYFSEEILSTLDRRKNIRVSDRATLFNLMIGLNGYTVSSGVISKELNGESIIARPLAVDEYMRIVTVTQKNMALSRYGQAYMEALKRYIPENAADDNTGN